MAKRVGRYDKATGELLQVYPSIRAAAAEFYGNPASICGVCRGKLKTAYGFVWKYYRIPTGEKGAKHETVHRDEAGGG